MSSKDLSKLENKVIDHGGTEPAFSGEYVDCYHEGFYHCRRCDARLYSSQDKFNSHCGWPSFDDEITGAVKRKVDVDGHRIEICCQHCDAHLGHVFQGEGFTTKNVRHCVNSVSMVFRAQKENTLETAVFGGGCFWCLEAFFQRLKAVVSVTSGYAGGSYDDASYEKVSQGNTGHAEVIRVVFDCTLLSYEELLLMFFDAHDPTSLNRQGHDVGSQYRSVIFFLNEKQKNSAQRTMQLLIDKQVYTDEIVTTLEKFQHFFPAEVEHKNYYQRNKNQQYCKVVISPKLKNLLNSYTSITS